MTGVSQDRVLPGRQPDCRHCGRPLLHTVVDLGMAPLCESFVAAEDLDRMEPFYPLHARVCEACFLVQVPEYVAPAEIFGGDYAYYSSYSDSWLAHARAYVGMIADRLALHRGSRVVEIGSNDGYLLQYFRQRGISALGVEPARNVARAAAARGVRTLVRLFDEALAREIVAADGPADLVLGNNVLAQVTDLNGFVRALKTLLAPSGVITLEFPHLVRLIADNQFDTIYHEHFSYFSLTTVERVAGRQELTVFDVEELPTHGGSLRVFLRHAEAATPAVGERVDALRRREAQAGVTTLAYYADFAERVVETKNTLLEFLIEARRRGRRVAGYGAPGKGNTLLNYCGIRSDLLQYTVDRNPYKHGKFTPGSHIPIHPPRRLGVTRPDYVLILPWNLTSEIVEQHAYVHEWGGQFVVPIPEVKVIA